MKPVLLAILLLLTMPALADDASLEARARALELQIRCVVCQSQSIADSEADLAADLRQLVHDRLAAGDDEATILAFLRSRYGDQILLRPPVDQRTALLWFAPPVFGLVSLVLVMFWLRRRSEEPLSEAEQSALDALDGEARG